MHQHLLKIVYAEWTIAALLTVAAVVCFVRSRRASYLFLPLLGVAYVAALHGTFFINDGSSDPVGLAVFGIVFGLFLGAPVGFVVMATLRRGKRKPIPIWPQTRFAWITATLGAGLIPVAVVAVAISGNGPKLRLPEDLLAIIFYAIVCGLIGAGIGNWARERG